MKRFPTRTLVLTAILVSLSIILSRFLGFYISETSRVSFGNLPILLAGIWLGAVCGGLTGGLADILGATVFSGLGIYFPLTIGPILTGAVAGIMARFFLTDGAFWRIALIVAVADICGSVFYSSWALSTLYGVPYFVTLLGRLPVNIGMAILEIVCIYILNRRLGSRFSVWQKGQPT